MRMNGFCGCTRVGSCVVPHHIPENIFAIQGQTFNVVTFAAGMQTRLWAGMWGLEFSCASMRVRQAFAVNLGDWPGSANKHPSVIHRGMSGVDSLSRFDAFIQWGIDSAYLPPGHPPATQ